MRSHLTVGAVCLAGLIVIHAVVAPMPVSAMELVVPTDFERLGAALLAAGAGDTVTVLPGEYWIDSHVVVRSPDLLIRSSAGPTITVLRGDLGGWEGDITFEWGTTPTTVLQGFTFRSFAEGPIEIWGGSPSLSNLVFEDCQIEGYGNPTGGAIRCEGGSPVLAGVRFTSNYAIYGGAFYGTNGGSPVFFGCSFESNWAGDGGAVYLGATNASFIACDFIDNEVRTAYSPESRSYIDAHGGAVYAYSGAPTFSQCRFIRNRAREVVGHDTVALGGAGCFTYQSAPSFSACTLVDNGASTLGGAILARDEAQISFGNSIIAFTTEGGGIVVEDIAAGATLACCDVYGNVGGDYVGLPDPTGQNGDISTNPLFCDLDAGVLTLSAGSPCLPEGNDCGVQMGALGEGCVFPTDIGAPPPTGIILDPNYPNPFNPSTSIPFSLDAPASVSVTVFDVSGRLVATLAHDETYPFGHHELHWDGLDAAGRVMPSGVYFYRLETPDGGTARTMLLVK